MGILLFIMGFICFAGAAGCLLVALKGKSETRAMYLVLTAIFVLGLLGTMVWYQTSVAPMILAQTCDSEKAAYKASQPVTKEALRGASGVKFASKPVRVFNRGKCRHTVTGEVEFKNSRGQKVTDTYSANMEYDPTTGKWTSLRRVNFDTPSVH